MDVKVHFCSSNLPFALLVKFFTFSEWSHVAIEVGGIVYEAKWSGVRKTTFGQLSKEQGKIFTKVVYGLDVKVLREFLDDQVGKPYDFPALFALPFRSNWGSEDAWFCSEYGAKGLFLAGFNFKNFPAWRVTPKDLFLMLGGSGG